MSWLQSDKRLVRVMLITALCIAGASLATPACRAQQPLTPGSMFRDCDDCPEMVVIPAGDYGFGSPPNEFGSPYNEGYILDVEFKRSFALGKYEVTFDQWEVCVRDGMCGPADDEGLGRGQQPVINVSWQDAAAYADWLAGKTGKPYRLPSEQEWEYAAQAGTKRARFFGISPDQTCLHGNVYDLTAHKVHDFGWSHLPCTDGYAELAPVGKFKANAFGVHDMLGNVWEWTQDCLNPNWRFSRAATDGSAFVDGDCDQRAYRGGSWLANQPYYLRTGERYKFSGARYNDLGFRVARSLD
ncbi:MAG TPA: SUMF1/EgtB/PvdO family nonheme iron enzyme [Burkholderiales bacterium]|nr:SUMF1/EgtB/PvdO family nonheme iron enzyme [Burkholderiales bacterium]